MMNKRGKCKPNKQQVVDWLSRVDKVFAALDFTNKVTNKLLMPHTKALGQTVCVKQSSTFLPLLCAGRVSSTECRWSMAQCRLARIAQLRRFCNQYNLLQSRASRQAQGESTRQEWFLGRVAHVDGSSASCRWSITMVLSKKVQKILEHILSFTDSHKLLAVLSFPVQKSILQQLVLDMCLMRTSNKSFKSMIVISHLS